MPQPKKPKKVDATKVIYVSPDDSPADEEKYEDESGIFLEKKDIHILYNALRAYKPVADEEQRYELLLEEFDEILVVDYNETPSDMN
jgi:hypothetical protein